MGKYIDGLRIETYRGIKDLQIEDISDFNIFVGDNNCGKTSLLEAVQILGNPRDFNGIVRIARARDRFRTSPSRSTQSVFDSLLNIFDKTKSTDVHNDSMKIAVACSNEIGSSSFELVGAIEKQLVSIDDIEKNEFANNIFENSIDEEVDCFVGKIIYESDASLISESYEKEVLLNKYSNLRISSSGKVEFNANYLSTIDHIVEDTFRNIVKDESFTKEVINLLQTFDKNILDLKVIPADDGRYYQAISSRDLGLMPVSTYGDGIKKIISFADAVLRARNGILLIDEIETAIHPRVMDEVYNFLISACKKYNVQLFATTHSLETVDKLLGCSPEEINNIRVITLKKKDKQTFSRVLTGEDARKLRINNDVELR